MRVEAFAADAVPAALVARVLAVFVARVFVAGFAAAAAAVAFDADFGALARPLVVFADGAASRLVEAFSVTGALACAFSAASARAVFDRAARALPAAVWAPLAFTARDAAMRAFVAFWAAVPWARADRALG